jgi:putative flippase GtrA
MITKLRNIIFTWEFIKFAAIGVCNTGLHAAIFLFLAGNHFSQFFANAIAFTIATMFSCIVNTLWNFKQKLQFRIIYRFFAVSIVGFFVTSSISGFGDYAHVNKYITIFLILCILPLTNFLLHKHWTYKKI